MFRFLAGAFLVGALVVMPMRAKFIASLTNLPPLAPQAKATLLEYALQFSPCDTHMLEKLGEEWIRSQHPINAAMAFGTGIRCAPGAAVMRFKYGEILLMMGYIEGAWFIDEARTLEPHNPIYVSESNRVRELQSRWPSLIR